MACITLQSTVRACLSHRAKFGSLDMQIRGLVPLLPPMSASKCSEVPNDVRAGMGLESLGAQGLGRQRGQKASRDLGQGILAWDCLPDRSR